MSSDNPQDTAMRDQASKIILAARKDNADKAKKIKFLKEHQQPYWEKK